jgi:hypothetical protein
MPATLLGPYMSCGPRPARPDPLGAGSGQPGARYTTYHFGLFDVRYTLLPRHSTQAEKRARRPPTGPDTGHATPARSPRTLHAQPHALAPRLKASARARWRFCESARHRLGTDERCERADMGGLCGAFEAYGSCAPSIVAEEVGGHGRPTGESNPAASGRPEAGYRSRATSVRHPLAVTAAPAGRPARRDTQSTGRPQQSGGNQ